MVDERQRRRSKTSRTKAVPQQEQPERKDSDPQFELPGETESAGDAALVQSPEGEGLASPGEENTYRGPERSKEEAARMSPTEEQGQHQRGDTGRRSSSVLAAAALIGVGALIEPELLVGMAIGGGLVLASGLIWDLVGLVAGGVVRPVMKIAVKAGYLVASQVHETVVGATEQVHDMVVEARAEQEGGASVH